MCDGVRTELITFICFITALNTNEAFAATAGRLPVIGAVSRVCLLYTSHSGRAVRRYYQKNAPGA